MPQRLPANGFDLYDSVRADVFPDMGSSERLHTGIPAMNMNFSINVKSAKAESFCDRKQTPLLRQEACSIVRVSLDKSPELKLQSHILESARSTSNIV